MKSDLSQLNETFERMESEGFDLKSNLKWGFYFFDSAQENLLKLSEKLLDQGYVYESLINMDDNDWRLYISIIDVLTPEELHNKNISFNELASLNNVPLYDGWDVEKMILM